MNRIMRELLNTAIYLLCVLGAVWLVITFVGQRTEVEGASMENTLHNGDNLIVDKLSYRFHDPERFDIIVFPFQFQDNTYYIKRIIGLPGETVYINDAGEIYINGTLLKDLHQRGKAGRELRHGSHKTGDHRPGGGTH